MPINCPVCGEPLTLKSARHEYKGKGAVSNGLLADLKPYLTADKPFITIDQSVDPILIPITRYDKELWPKVMAIIRKHDGTWNKERRRWEVPA